MSGVTKLSILDLDIVVRMKRLVCAEGGGNNPGAKWIEIPVLVEVTLQNEEEPQQSHLLKPS